MKLPRNAIDEMMFAATFERYYSEIYDKNAI